MIHEFPGLLGNFFITLMFVTAVAAAFAFFRATQLPALRTHDRALLQRFGRTVFGIHVVSVMGVVATLFFIVYNHYYEYHYAWSYSSEHLPTQYIIASFWNGQEGSFLLWLFWHAVLGVIVMATNRRWEAPVMTIFALVQAFLASMILGVVIPGLDLKIGSSPFMLLRDVMQSWPVFQINPDYVPVDGRGLNPSLQNYWMVIHPPTLFLGYALTIVPFAFAIAGLWQRQYHAWVRPALPWALVGSLVLGVGILMGAYWAYETLNFGGYWNWDPVENAVYIPWLMLVAGVHTLVIARRNGSALGTSLILVIASFLLVLYATFLTRSGILGESSVHSFTDLGLSGQLLLYLFTFLILSAVLLTIRWKELPFTDKEVKVYSGEFWIFIAATILGLASFQVLVPTSIPVYSKLIGLLGIESNLAPPADQVGFYTKWQLWFGVAIAFASALGQFFWWKKLDAKNWLNHLTTPLIVALLLSAGLIVLTKVDNFVYITLLTVGAFSLVANGMILWRIVRGNYQLSGGAVSHIGVGLMLIGIMFSSGYSKVISKNQTGMLLSKDFSDEANRDNVLLWRGTPQAMAGYTLTYLGPRLEARHFPGYLNEQSLRRLDQYRAVAREDITWNDKTYFAQGDTLELFPENTYHEIRFSNEAGEEFTMYPRVQINEDMGGIAPSPDIKKFADHDIYLHVSSIMAPDQEREWSEAESFKVAVGDTFVLNDFIAELVSVERVDEVEGISLGANDAAVRATVRVLGSEGSYILRPAFVIKDQMVGRIPETSGELGLRLALTEIDPATGEFTFEASTTQKDWLIIKAMEKPYINVLWIGSLLMSLGFGMAAFRRYRDFRQMRDKDREWDDQEKSQKATPVGA
ncbi:cytochrome c-type biogenesis protein CcmF [Catalinimonas alkaloidigena]|uniref:Cytochrome c-type biogenesis protein CcmF n=1 Tax=Catalinimonas alkaloidigena TaxID=1075417 RepID=A0A1G9F1W4_9BACT|nr:cytochrome c biogenesis protein CcsA [Catalinimonas alkaloidigena]SDK82427.1 cytochrome c-type biogenesis protein CcmF [Catalinimonas alkaloidigena]